MSYNLGLILGAARLGALFGHATGPITYATATRAQIALATSLTFAAATVLLIAAIAILRR